MNTSNAVEDKVDNVDHPTGCPPAATDASATDRGAASLITVMLFVSIAVVSGAIGAVAIDKSKPRPQRILVLDMAGLLDPIANDPALSAYEKRRITEDLGAAVNRTIAIEADNGAIILDASLVLRAPGGSYVQP